MISRCSWPLQYKLYCYRSGKGNCRGRPHLSRVSVPSVYLVSFAFMSSQVRRGPRIRKWGTGKALTWRDGAAWHPWSPRCPRGLRRPSRMIRNSLRSSSNKRRWLNTALTCECGCHSSWISWEPGTDSSRQNACFQRPVLAPVPRPDQAGLRVSVCEREI